MPNPLAETDINWGCFLILIGGVLITIGGLAALFFWSISR